MVPAARRGVHRPGKEDGNPDHEGQQIDRHRYLRREAQRGNPWPPVARPVRSEHGRCHGPREREETPNGEPIPHEAQHTAVGHVVGEPRDPARQTCPPIRWHPVVGSVIIVSMTSAGREGEERDDAVQSADRQGHAMPLPSRTAVPEPVWNAPADVGTRDPRDQRSYGTRVPQAALSSSGASFVAARWARTAPLVSPPSKQHDAPIVWGRTLPRRSSPGAQTRAAFPGGWLAGAFFIPSRERPDKAALANRGGIRRLRRTGTRIRLPAPSHGYAQIPWADRGS